VERRRFPIGSRRRRAVPADEGAAPVEETRPEMDADPVHRQPSDT
jgi:hypothetical protein